MQQQNQRFSSLYTVRTLKEGLHQAVALCIEQCHAAGLSPDDSWFKTVVLAGGTACLPGLVERLDKELRLLLPPSISSGIRVIPPPYGADSAWYGAKLLSNDASEIIYTANCCLNSDHSVWRYAI
ncbi:putative Actin family, ATPase, nucleotide binding domain-containing protein [Helianthus annuus]|nr:putative Actin family, ATPase, nucleotide binding domain-containing protein [Helianthus annuus]KAJ0516839.1 putative Actin family, ATPase, nucleotide binding domain-containing protein [Helianthus annuus]KAJ0684844.1 putative Actin family, ATPase, nucleotide binding domain-containing protein [Helianthus annuus]KAJ0688771.1 putative Actin family, ATPase, nucleotide binding domain-containing protein [Helianthus annuus]